MSGSSQEQESIILPISPLSLTQHDPCHIGNMEHWTALLDAISVDLISVQDKHRIEALVWLKVLEPDRPSLFRGDPGAVAERLKELLLLQGAGATTAMCITFPIPYTNMCHGASMAHPCINGTSMARPCINGSSVAHPCMMVQCSNRSSCSTACIDLALCNPMLPHATL